MSRVGQYRHITVEMPLNLEAIAESLLDANYGVHNMLSAIVIAYRRKYPERELPSQEHDWDIVPKIEKHLEEGDF